jgi:cysteine desulfurase
MEIYMDAAATTPIDHKVQLEMQNAPFANPSSIHTPGEKARDAVESARKKIAAKIGCDKQEVYFTSGATEANNLAIRSYVSVKKNHIICSEIEHASIMEVCLNLESEGIKVTWLKVNSIGLVDLDQLKNSINSKTAVVAIMHSNNEIGTVQNEKKIGEICRKRSVPWHCDIVQSFCKVKVNIENMNSVSISAHKINGPKGIGALIMKNSSTLKPIFYGGGQESCFRPGTENLQGIIGFGKAIDVDQQSEKLEKFRDYMIHKILAEIPGSSLNGHPTNRLPNNISINFDGIEGENLLRHLNLENVFVSTGSACSSKKIDVSHVLLSCGQSKIEAASAIRISFLNSVKQEEIEIVITILKKIVATLREI